MCIRDRGGISVPIEISQKFWYNFCFTWFWYNSLSGSSKKSGALISFFCTPDAWESNSALNHSKMSTLKPHVVCPQNVGAVLNRLRTNNVSLPSAATPPTLYKQCSFAPRKLLLPRTLRRCYLESRNVLPLSLVHGDNGILRKKKSSPFP